MPAHRNLSLPSICEPPIQRCSDDDKGNSDIAEKAAADEHVSYKKEMALENPKRSTDGDCWNTSFYADIAVG